MKQTLKASTISWGLYLEGQKHHKQEKFSVIPDCASHRGTGRRRNDICEDVVFLAFNGKGSRETGNGSLGCRILQESKRACGLIG